MNKKVVGPRYKLQAHPEKPVPTEGDTGVLLL